MGVGVPVSDSDDESEVFDADQLRSVIAAMDAADGDAEDTSRYDCLLRTAVDHNVGP